MYCTHHFNYVRALHAYCTQHMYVLDTHPVRIMRVRTVRAHFTYVRACRRPRAHHPPAAAGRPRLAAVIMPPSNDVIKIHAQR